MCTNVITCAWGVIDARRGSYMAKATSSRERSRNTEAPVRSNTLPDSEPAKNYPEISKGTDSQNGNADTSPKEARRPRATVAIEPCAPFLTGSDPQREFDVTRPKQTTEKFLTGARTAISVSRKHTSNRDHVELQHAATH